MNFFSLYKNYLQSNKDHPSGNTVKNYLADLKRFQVWIEQSESMPFDPNSITSRSIELFMTYLKNASYAPSTIERQMSSLRNFFLFLKQNNLIEKNPFDELKSAQNISSDLYHLTAFKNFLYTEGKEASTMKNYLLDVNHFLTWLEKVTIDYVVSDDAKLAKINTSTILEYTHRLLNYLRLSPVSVNRKLSSLKKYCQWAHDNGYLKENPFQERHIEQTQGQKTPEQVNFPIGVEKSLIVQRQYARFPPIRLLQKLLHFLDYLLLIFVLAPAIRLLSMLKGIKTSKPYVWRKTGLTQKTFYTQYKQPILTNIGPKIALLLGVFISLVGISILIAHYSFQNTNKPIELVAPPMQKTKEIFTFSGRLIDKDDNPVTIDSPVIFSFYETPEDFDKLLYQEAAEVTPDSQGFFTVTLPSVPTALLKSSTPVYLGITIQGDGEMRPREVINPKTASIPSILSEQEENFAIPEHSFITRDPSGNLKLIGSSIILRTSEDSDGSIVLWPVNGKIDLRSPLVNSVTGNVEVADSLGIYTSGSSNPFMVSTNTTPLFAINSEGAISAYGSLSLLGNATLQSNLTVLGDTTLFGGLSNLGSGGLYGLWYDDTGTPGEFRGRVIKQSILEGVNLDNFTPSDSLKEFSVKIVGYLKPKYSETFTFYITATDGVRLWVNRTRLIDSWGSESESTRQASISLTKDRWYPIILEHFQDDTTDKLKLEWASSTQVRQVLPADRLAYSLSEVPQTLVSDLRVERQLTVAGGASFGGGLTPSSSNNFDLGSTSNLWQNLHISSVFTSGNMGIGTSSPVQRFQVNPSGGNSVVVTSGGNLGVGTTSPTSKLQIVGGNCEDDFGGGGCTADYAEYYPASQDVEKGDVLVIDEASPTYAVEKSSTPYQATLIGIVSTNPAAIADRGTLSFMHTDYQVDPMRPAVALLGRVPVKVSMENGPIKPGDYLTSSSTPGVAMKAMRAGPVVGKALEPFYGSGDEFGVMSSEITTTNQEPITHNQIGKILAFINVSWHDPDVLLTSTGQVILKEATYSGLLNNVSDIKHQVSDIEDNIIEKTKDIAVAGQNLDSYIGTIVKNILTTSSIVAPIAELDIVKTNRLSPLSSDTVFVDGKLTTNKLISGELEVTSDATISGTLRTARLVADDIEGLEAKIASLAGVYKSRENSDFNLSASDSASLRLDSLFTNTGSFLQGLLAIGPAGFSDISVTGIVSIGSTFILSDNTINVLGADLALQPLSQGGISIAGGKVYIDSMGNMQVAGNLDVHGTLRASIISPIPQGNLIIKLGSNQESGIRNQGEKIHHSSFIIHDSSDSAVLRITDRGDLVASGSAQFVNVATEKLRLPELIEKIAADGHSEVSYGSVGKAVIASGTYEITIQTPFVTEVSLIYITPTSDPLGMFPYVARLIPGASFTVAISDWVNQDITFNWWIIN